MARILVVDDDDAVRRTVCLALERAGYGVVEQANALNAAPLMSDPTISLVVTDVMMPEMDGIELIREVKRNRCDLPIIAMSGGGSTNFQSLLRYCGALGADRTLAKPFRASELIGLVQDLLGDGDEPPGDAATR